jgi:adenylate cyclase
MEEKKMRQLSAIMFTDIVGYTALMQGNEAVAAKARTRHREVFEQQHQIHRGEIIQYYGDGTLSVFKSAVDATECAIEIQKQMLHEEPVPLRIGLHMGDIVFDKSEVYGDGVNVASRIQNLSVAGSIFISEKLNEELRNHTAITTASLGRFELKNVSRPVEVFAVTIPGIVVPPAEKLQGNQQLAGKTIAVLPFLNMSANVENEYFSDGITEEIINALSKIKSLKVTSRTSCFFFKNKNIPIRQIGKELNVSTILEGSVRLSGSMIRITAQLIQAEEDFHFWSETWDRKLEDIFEIQDEISLLIADKLREHFGHFEIQEHLVEKQTDNFSAYEYYLKARYHAQKWNPEDLRIAISLYEQALALDPKHTESYLGLGDCYGFMATTGFMPFEEAWGKTAQLINQAHDLNDRLPGVHFQLANLAFFTACDYREAFRQTETAIALKPNYVEAQQFMSFFYIIAGEKEKAAAHLEIALRIDPLSPETLFFSAYFEYMIENYVFAIEKLDRCLQQNPKNLPAHTVKCYCLLKLGRSREMMQYLETIPSDILAPGYLTGLTGLAYAIQGDAVKSAEYLQKIEENAKGPDGFRSHSYLFLMYALTGKKDKAFEWISEAIAMKSSLLLFHFADPLVNAIKDDPRYVAFHEIIYRTDVEKKSKAKQNEVMNTEAVSVYSMRLLKHINEKKPYLDPDLSLRKLSEQISLHPDKLSWLLNERYGKNFNDFINHYRLETFQMLMKEYNNSKSKLTQLIRKSGFKSKTAFHAYIERETGQTAVQYLNSLQSR